MGFNSAFKGLIYVYVVPKYVLHLLLQKGNLFTKYLYFISLYHFIVYVKHNGISRIKIKQDGHCTYNVTLRRFGATIISAKKQLSIKYYECESVSLS